MNGRVEGYALPKALPIDMIAWTTLYMHFSPLPPVERTQLCSYHNKFLMGNICVSIDKQQAEILADLIHELLFPLLKNQVFFSLRILSYTSSITTFRSFLY